MITCLQFLLHVISSTLLRLIFKFLRITVGEVLFISFGHVEREEGEGGGGVGVTVLSPISLHV